MVLWEFFKINLGGLGFSKSNSPLYLAHVLKYSTFQKDIAQELEDRIPHRVG